MIDIEKILYIPEYVRTVSMLIPVLSTVLIHILPPNKVLGLTPLQPGRRYPRGTYIEDARRDDDDPNKMMIPSGAAATIRIARIGPEVTYIDDIQVFDYRRHRGSDRQPLETGHATISGRTIDEYLSSPGEPVTVETGYMQAVYLLTQTEEQEVI